MNSTVTTTAGLTSGTVAVAAVINWVANTRLGLGMPPDVVAAFAAGAITAGHYVRAAVNARAAGNSPTAS